MSYAGSKGGILYRCTIEMYDRLGKRVGTEMTTKPVLEPKIFWGESFMLDLDESVCGVAVTLWGKDKFKEHFFGTFAVLRDFIPYNRGISHWFPLHPSRNHQSFLITGDVSANLHLLANSRGIESVVQPPLVDLKMAQLHFQERVEERKLREQNPGGKILLKWFYNPPKERFEGSVHITVVSGSKLDAKDLNGFSDPYVTLELITEGKERDADTFKKTSIKMKTLDPYWNETFVFYLPARPELPLNEGIQLDLNVWDW